MSIPTDACVAVLGEAQCSAAGVPADGSPAPQNPYGLISVPVSVCAAILGQAQCTQMPQTSGGLVDVPVGICLAVLGKTLCDQATNPKGGASSAGSSTTPVVSVPVGFAPSIFQ